MIVLTICLWQSSNKGQVFMTQTIHMYSFYSIVRRIQSHNDLEIRILASTEDRKESSSFSPTDAKQKLNFLFFELG